MKKFIIILLMLVSLKTFGQVFMDKPDSLLGRYSSGICWNNQPTFYTIDNSGHIWYNMYEDYDTLINDLFTYDTIYFVSLVRSPDSHTSETYFEFTTTKPSFPTYRLIMDFDIEKYLTKKVKW
jgi:hypothetical protein